MYRINGRKGKYYALKIDDIYDDLENLQIFVDSSEPIIYCNEIEDLDDFFIDKNDVEIVEADDE